MAGIQLTEEFWAAMIVELIYDDYFWGVGKGLKILQLQSIFSNIEVSTT